MSGRAGAVLAWLTAAAGGLLAQTPAGERAEDRNGHGDERAAALLRQHDDGAVDVKLVLAALGDASEAVRRTAAGVVRHTWLDLPTALFDGLDHEPRAARALLDELALAPRPAARAWVERWAAGSNRSVDERLLALAARGEPPTAPEARLLVEALATDPGEGFFAACRTTPSAAADTLIGRLHQGLAAGTFGVDRCVPLLDRLSLPGTRRLLGLVVSLPPAVGGALSAQVAERLPQVVAERAGDAIDHDPVLDAVWLRHAGGVLTTALRIERVDALLRDASTDEARRQLAFFALVEARQPTPAVLDYAEAIGEAGLSRVLAHAADRVPAARLQAWLTRGEQSARVVATHLSTRRELGAGLEAQLLGMVREARTVDGVFFRLATSALLQHGGASTVAELWPWLRQSRDWPDFVDLLAHRQDAFVPALLRAELAAAAPGVEAAVRQRQLEALALALCALGDAAELPRLIAGAQLAPPAWLRRCRAGAGPLPRAAALTLLQLALGAAALESFAPAERPSALARVADHERQIELLDWAGTGVADDTVREVLVRLWRQPPPAVPPGDDAAAERRAQHEELRDVAMRALVDSVFRANLVADLRAAVAAGPLDDAVEASAFELLAAMRAPLTAADLELAAELVLLRPCTDPEREARLAERWTEGLAGFPLVAAVAQRLRGADPAAVARAFTVVVARVMQDARHRQLLPARFLLLWRSLVFAADLQLAVGTATAPLVLALEPGPHRAAAEYFALRAADAAGDHVAAMAHARRALPLALDLTQRLNARTLLGERDPEAGHDPLAALAAAPYLHEHLRARAAGDAQAAARAAAAVRELAGHDVTTLQRLQETTR